MKRLIKCLTVIGVAMAMSQTAFALEADILGAGDGKFLISGSISSEATNKNVAITVYKPEKTASDITADNPLSALYAIRQVTADSDGRFKYVLTTNGDCDDFAQYSVVVSDSTGTEVITKAVANPLKAVITTTEFGNIFYDSDEISYTATITDSSLMAQEAQIKALITDRVSGATVSEKTLSVTFAENGKASYVDTIEKPAYGVYDINLTISASGVETSKAVSTFSNVRQADMMNKKMGIQYHFGHGMPKDNQSGVTKAFVNAGYGLGRDNMNWSFYESIDDNFTIKQFLQAYMDEAEAKGIDVMLTTSNANLQLINETVISSTEALAEYGEYIYNMVYDTVGQVSGYEIMNEVNHFNGDETKKMTTTQYLEIVRVASENIDKAIKQKAQDTGVTYTPDVIAGALAYVDYEGGETDVWVEELFAAGLADYIDAFSYHIYTQGYKPEHITQSKQLIANKINEIIRKYDADMPIILSELGYSSTSDYEGTQLRQAAYELRDFVLLYDKFDKMYFYAGTNKQNEDSEYERELGHLETWSATAYNSTGVPFAAKPVYAAMANYNTLLANAELIEKNHTLLSTKYDYVFKNAEGDRVHVLWNSADTDTTYTISSEYTTVKLYDMYGNETELSSNTGSYTVTIGMAPCYIVEDVPKALTVKNAEGAEADVLEDTVYIKTNETDGFSSAKVIVALYNQGKMLSCQSKDFSELTTNGMELTTSGADELRVIVVGNMSKINPLMEKTEILKEK